MFRAVVSLLLLPSVCAFSQAQSASAYIGKWLNSSNPRDRLHIEKQSEAVIVRRLNYKTVVNHWPATYRQGALYVSDVLTISFVLDEKSKTIASPLGRYRKMSASDEQKANLTVQAAIDAEISRQDARKRSKAEEQERARLKADTEKLCFRLQSASEIADIDTFKSVLTKRPDLINSNFNGGWGPMVLLSREIPTTVKRKFLSSLVEFGLDVRNRNLIDPVIRVACEDAFGPLGYADNEAKFLDLMDIALQLGGRPNDLDRNGNTALDYLVERGGKGGRLFRMLAATGAKHADDVRPLPSTSSDFGIVPMNGRGQFKLAQNRGQVVIVTFFKRGLFDWSHQLSWMSKYSRVGLRVIGVGVSDRRVTEGEIAKCGVIPLFYDKSGAFADALGVSSMLTSHGPCGTSVLIGKDGSVLRRWDTSRNSPVVSWLDEAGLWNSENTDARAIRDLTSQAELATDLLRAEQASSTEGLPLLVVFVAEWSAPCKSLRVGLEAAVKSGRLKGLIVCFVDFDKSSKEQRMQYSVGSGVPHSVLVTGPSGQQVSKVGYKSVDEYLGWVREHSGGSRRNQ